MITRTRLPQMRRATLACCYASGNQHSDDIPPEAFLVAGMPPVNERAHSGGGQFLLPLDQVPYGLALRRMRLHLKESPDALCFEERRIEREARRDTDEWLSRASRSLQSSSAFPNASSFVCLLMLRLAAGRSRTTEPC